MEIERQTHRRTQPHANLTRAIPTMHLFPGSIVDKLSQAKRPREAKASAGILLFVLCSVLNNRKPCTWSSRECAVVCHNNTYEQMYHTLARTDVQPGFAGELKTQRFEDIRRQRDKHTGRHNHTQPYSEQFWPYSLLKSSSGQFESC